MGRILEAVALRTADRSGAPAVHDPMPELAMSEAVAR